MNQTTQRTAWQELRLGWPTLLAAALGVATGAATISYYTISIFIGPLTQEFGWSRTLFSSIVFADGIALALFSPIAGWAADRFGIRGPSALSALAIALCFLGLSQTSGNFAIFVALHLLMHTLGAASGPVTYTRAVNQVFNRMRGLALGCTIGGGGIMALIAPPLLAQIIETQGWRVAYLTLGGIVLCAIPVCFFLISIGPRRMARADMHSAGLPHSVQTTEATESSSPAMQIPLTLRTAFRNTLFLRLLFIIPLLAIGIGGITQHMVPLLTDSGLTLMEAAKIQGLIGLAVLIGRLGTGFLVDQFFAPFVAGGVMLLAALGILALAIVGPAIAPVSAFLIGFALGTEGDLIGYLVARYFGLVAYGRLYGVLVGIYAAGLGLAPIVTAALQEYFGTYTQALFVSALILITGAILLLRFPRFRPEPEVMH